MIFTWDILKVQVSKANNFDFAKCQSYLNEGALTFEHKIVSIICKVRVKQVDASLSVLLKWISMNQI